MMRSRIKEQPCHISSHARKVGPQNAEASTETSHRQPQQKNSCGHIGGQVRDVRVQHCRRKKPPPFTGPNRLVVHAARCLQNTKTDFTHGEKYREQEKPYGAPPIEDQPTPREISAPEVGTIFRLILANGFKRAGVLEGRYDQLPAVVLVRALDGRFDSLAQQDQTPIHGLAFGASWNDVVFRFHCEECTVWQVSSNPQCVPYLDTDA